MSTKTRILNTLLIKKEASVNELAEELGVNDISIRHHLKNFERDGLVVYREAREGQVGRPKFLYSLSSLGIEQFPKSYVEFSSILIDQLKHTLKPEQIDPFFKEVGFDMAERNRLDRRQRNSPKRLNHVIENLNGQGYMIELEEIDGETVMVNYHCPYYYLSTAYPEICNLDQSMLEELCEAEVVIQHTIADGSPTCFFRIK